MVSIIAVGVSGTPFLESLGGFDPGDAATVCNSMLVELAPELATTGLLRADGTARPAFDVVIDAAISARG